MRVTAKNGVLVVTGDLDRFSLGKKSLNYFPDLTGKVKVDLSETQTIDTAGVAWLLKLVAYYQKHNQHIELTNPSEQLIALAKVSNVLGLLPFSDN